MIGMGNFGDTKQLDGGTMELDDKGTLRVALAGGISLTCRPGALEVALANIDGESIGLLRREFVEGAVNVRSYRSIWRGVLCGMERIDENPPSNHLPLDTSRPGDDHSHGARRGPRIARRRANGFRRSRGRDPGVGFRFSQAVRRGGAAGQGFG